MASLKPDDKSTFPVLEHARFYFSHFRMTWISQRFQLSQHWASVRQILFLGLF